MLIYKCEARRPEVNEMKKSQTLETTETAAIAPMFGVTSTPEPSGVSTVAITPEGLQYRTALGHEATEDHQHVALVWQKKCVPFANFVAQNEELAKGKFDRMVPESQVRFNPDLTLAAEIRHPNGDVLTEVRFTEKGMRTMLTNTPRLGNAWLDTMNDLGTVDQYTAEILNQELDNGTKNWCNPVGRKNAIVKGLLPDGSREEREFLLRLRPDSNDQSKTVIRATASERYTADLDNRFALQLISDFFESQGKTEGLLVSHGDNDGDNIFGSVLVPDRFQNQTDSDYGLGIKFSNSETKDFTFNIQPYLFRCICVNGCIWGRQDSAYSISKKHIGKLDIEELRTEFFGIMSLALSHGKLFANQFYNANQIDIDNVQKYIYLLGKKNMVTEPQMRAWYECWKVEGDATAAGIVNGLTRAAHTKYNGNDQHILEGAAGTMLTPSLECTMDELQRYWASIGDSRISSKDESNMERLFAGR